MCSPISYDVCPLLKPRNICFGGVGTRRPTRIPWVGRLVPKAPNDLTPLNVVNTPPLLSIA